MLMDDDFDANSIKVESVDLNTSSRDSNYRSFKIAKGKSSGTNVNGDQQSE